MNTVHANIGDHLVSTRFCYTHHGIYIGDNCVIHYLNEDGVIIDSLATFSQGEEVYVREHPFRFYSAEESVNRAMSRLGDDNYNVVLNNCEHFVNWCISGLHVSGQVNTVAAVGVAPFIARGIATKAAPTVIRSIVGAATASSGTTSALAAGAVGFSGAAALGGVVGLAAIPVYKGVKNVVDNFDLCDGPMDVISAFGEGVGETCEGVVDFCGDVWDGITSFFD